ncbi:MAG: hypothetical protein A2527_07605 [Candidatus Lambdaproteobacteria bacterium RIFOXYD2_FULL_50_16]|uniref:Protein-glutamate methylesterase/protein-glutamine glutaminase n=1 Tax=Candidatus Lambdaproteobacteria bacterium RIFOXYD2_FULL_50_16 TaxID=1817772 RepID=A0A1F6GB90_9PROT|nr:MAG: hypothetical protein A2527_07605 [Candidatus Lambdaproteobacteria bacterium RIFOXYD2_FULL_50_16]
MPYKVLVVDDSALMRSEISKIIEKDSELQVVGTAINGQFALDKIKSLDPDVVTMDVNMPVMDGLEALKRIMAEFPRPVVMISSLTQEGAEETIKALEAGAVDFVAKPSGSISRDIDRQSDNIREKIKAAAKSRANKSFIRRPSVPVKTILRQPAPSFASAKVVRADGLNRDPVVGPQGPVVGIGVSTGGPKTLMSLLPELPGDFPGCVVIAQHMPEKFTASFAQRLDNLCPLRVKEAEDGEVLESGTVYIAPGGRHMSITHRNHKIFMIKTTSEGMGKIYRPSVDILFESLSEAMGNAWLGVMLTGMGADGAQALVAHYKNGGHSICESEESCVVFGMPGRVVEMGGAEFILHENQISAKIVELIGEYR